MKIIHRKIQGAILRNKLYDYLKNIYFAQILKDIEIYIIF